MHYVCTGDCHGVSDEPKNCGDMTCSRYNKPLTGCDCTDGKHEEAMMKGKEMEEFKEELPQN